MAANAGGDAGVQAGGCAGNQQASKSQPASAPAHTAPRPVVQRRPASADVTENPLDIDWITWLLGLLALIAVGGLIPFCIWVYYVVYPPF